MSETVKALMDAELDKIREEYSALSRSQVAQCILAVKPGWYTQTPEGEYLLKVSKEH